ncbi:hypothetical protein GCM10007147_31590 [Nocardiopsis kunsanensis]|uniref:Uncharacterized protein n=1 Tax=Nocardiopsis kunsanensis TaxID=141693 RepID=A0A918XFS6_9ACTN|nr:hypothetical protein GCM10007147_31590 [Nocardiopsis kunsanensis]
MPEAARAARLGHRMPGWFGPTNTSPETEERVHIVLETLWAQSVCALTPAERERLFSMAPSLEELYREGTKNGLPEEPASKTISRISPIVG